jgi:hypothetical protein
MGPEANRILISSSLVIGYGSFRYVDTIADKPTGVRTSPDESYLAIAMKVKDNLNDTLPVPTRTECFRPPELTLVTNTKKIYRAMTTCAGPRRF